MTKPKPINEEIELDNNVYIESDTDTKGIITYVNDYFAKISRYSKQELIGQPHSIVRHPDMPKILFKILWDSIKKGKNIHVAIKNLAKDGKFYWVFTDFTPLKNDKDEIVGYKAARKKISKHVTQILDPLYKKLTQIEKDKNTKESQIYLDNFLKQHGDDITIENLLENIHKLY